MTKQGYTWVDGVPIITDVAEPGDVTTTATSIANSAVATHALTPHGGTHPDLAAHDALGLATQAELDTHAQLPHGGGAWTTVMATSDLSKNASATVTDDGVLQVTLAANTQYSLYLIAFFQTNATADLKYRLVFTGTTTRVRRKVGRTATSDVAPTTELKTTFDAADVVLSTTGLNPWLEEDIILQVGASGGVLKLQWAQVTSGPGPTTRLEGSYLMWATS